MGSSNLSLSLVLGAGGARGLAHIGVIEELLARGYRIVSIAGSSMGALVGGIYAAGKLEEYRDWVIKLQRLDVLRLLDFTWRGGGMIRGERVISVLRELVGEHQIESLPVSYTAVAVDIDAEREVWLSRGSLFSAIRASIAIPGIFTPLSCMAAGWWMGAAQSRPGGADAARPQRSDGRGERQCGQRPAPPTACTARGGRRRGWGGRSFCACLVEADLSAAPAPEAKHDGASCTFARSHDAKHYPPSLGRAPSPRAHRSVSGCSQFL